MKPVEKLIKTYQALDSMEVKGFSNAAALAGAMQVLADVINELQTAASADTEDTEK